MYASVEKTRRVSPIVACNFRGVDYIIDGNHRAAICLKLGIELEAEMISSDDYLRKISTNPKEFYGSKHRDMPYQSVYSRGERLIEGRRTDIIERFHLIQHADIVGKNIVDIGCNLGANCILACEKGAMQVVGLDISPRICTSAIKINCLLGYPIFYLPADLSKAMPPFNFTIPGSSITAFALSIDQHIGNNTQLALNLSQFDVVYFETHENSTVPKTILKFFDSKYMGGSGKQRKVYRLTKKDRG